MNWAQPGWLLWLPAAALVGVLIGVGASLHRRRLREVFSAPLMAEVLPLSVRVRRIVRDVSAVLGLALLLVSLAEPRFDKQIRTIKTVGTDVVILLDLSRSMNARDVDPSRLERARREIRDLGRMAAGDRFGLVVFAGGAYPRLPLTQDFRAVELVMSETDTSTFESQGSALGRAIRAGTTLLQRSQEQAGQALIVLSDGETHDPDDAVAAAQEALAAGVPIYAMGIGIEPSPIPMPNGKMFMYEGQVAITTPDFTVLEEVARITGGAFVQSNASERDMEGLYQEIRRKVRAVERETQQRETWRTAYRWPLTAATLLLLLSAWIGDGRRLWGAATAVLLAVLALGASPAHAADPLYEADQSYRAGDYPQAVELLTELSLERPDDPVVFDRLGAARYRAEDWEGSARAFDRAAQLDGHGADALYNAGNAHYRAGRLEQAAQRYQQALEEDPDHPGASRNLPLVQQEIVLRRQQPPPPPPQPAEGQDGEEGEPSDPQDGEGPPQDSEPVGLDDVEPTEESEKSDESDGGTGTMGEDAGPITAGQAHRLLDAIEEGSQRVSVSGTREDKPW